MKTRRTLQFLFLLPLAILMTGCPYSSEVPLGDPQESVIDPALLGKWVTCHQGDVVSTDTLWIMEFNRHEYLIVFNQSREGKCLIECGRGFITVIDKTKILNFTGLGEPARFNFNRYEMKGSLMITSSASDQFIRDTFTSSGALCTYFRNNMDTEGFFEAADTLRKVQ